MANLKVFDPLFDDPFERTFRGFLRPLRWDTEVELPQIRIDVEENDKAYTVKAEIPGVSKEDITVQVEGGQVSIQAEVKRESDVKESKGKTLRTERYYGMLSRAFTLAHDIDASRAEARYENGVLNLTLPKKEGTASKRLSIL